jgi:DNA repair exonuclease SbcCD ATPase subunit
MKTLQEDIDDLDRMVDTDAQKDNIRSQIRLVAREVAELEADNARLVESHSQLQETLAKANAELEKVKAEYNEFKNAQADETTRPGEDVVAG